MILAVLLEIPRKNETKTILLNGPPYSAVDGMHAEGAADHDLSDHDRRH